MGLFKRKPPPQKPIAIPTAASLSRIDDATLLSIEREARKNHKKAIAKAVGASSKLVYKSPMAVASIAKSGLATKETYIQHSDVLKEVQRRGLTPLEQAPDENLYVMIAGQLVAVVAGKAVGDTVAHSVLEPLVTHFGGIAVEHMTAKFTEAVAEEATENTFQAILGRANIKIPGFNLPKKQKTTTGTTFASSSSSPSTPAPTLPTRSRDVLASVQQQPAFIVSPDQSQARPLSPKPLSRPGSGTGGSTGNLSRTQTLVKTGVALATTAITTGISTATQIANTLKTTGKTTSATNLDHNDGSKTAHFNGTWIGFGEELEIVVVDSLDPDEDKELAALKPKIGTPDHDDKGGLEGVAVVARYRMKFELVFDAMGHTFVGDNVVDELKVDGVVSDNGFFVDFGETAKGVNGEEVKVAYRGRIGGGLLIGEWISSDGRQGLFRLKHV
ncbi:UNVERIFIED_CONTAM: hypothetical protein HDU68_008035 [Siphonaria sp. JEL0065]|nr:hypothetical protein HDU68_008035 [Siphonaria sp. JEL0065]